jgi:hypothetical protein
VYAGRDGNVYRQQGGSWQKYDNGSWSGVNQPAQQPSGANRQGASTTQPRADTATVNQLNRDAAARNDGAQRTSAATASRSGSAGARSGSYRPSGGGRGGGGRRR